MTVRRDWPLTISLPQGLTVGGVTTWALRLAVARAGVQQRTRLVVHEPHEPYATMTTARPDDPAIEWVTAPRLTDPDRQADNLSLYRELLPTVLSPNLLNESYAIAAALALVHPEQLRVVGWCHLDNPYDYAHLAYYAPVIARFVAVSGRCCAELQQRLPQRSGEIVRLPYGIPIPEAVARGPLQNRPLRLIYAGRMQQSVKRVFDYPDLALRLAAAGVRFELRLVGDGPDAGELQRRIAAALPRVSAAGSRIWLESTVAPDDMPQRWQWADIALLTSTREGFSVAMSEAMSHGCVPAVSHVASGVDDIIQDGISGLIFPVGDTEALAHRLRDVADAPECLPRLAAAAHAAIRASSAYPQYFARVQGLLEEVVTTPPPRWPISRPVAMGTVAGSGTVPHDAHDRLARVLTAIAAADAGPVAIYGAGGHTQALAATLAESPVEICAVLDDDGGRHGGGLWGWPVVPPEAVDSTPARSIVLSSWMYEAELAVRHAGVFAAAGVRVWPIYGGVSAAIEAAAPQPMAAGAA